MEDELELGDGFSGTDEEYELGEERRMSDETTPPEAYEEDDILGEAFGIGIDPPTGYLNERFTITTFGIPAKTRSLKFRTVVRGLIPRRSDDPIFAISRPVERVAVIGTTFLRGRKLDPTVPNIVEIYAQADIPKTLFNPLGIDKYTPTAQIKLLPVSEVVSPTPTPYVPPTPTPYGPPTPTPYGPPTPTPAVCREGAYTADGKSICRGGVFVPVGAPAVKEYLTSQEADRYVREGKACYIKCMIPILNIFPGIPYFTGCPILPGFAIKTKP